MSSTDTALCVLDLRRNSGIKYAEQMATLLSPERAQERLFGPENIAHMRACFAGWAELRHRAIERKIDQFGADILADIAAGFGLRPLIFTESLDRDCLETDKTEESVEAKRIVTERMRGGRLHPNHTMMSLNALERTDWERAAEWLDRFGRHQRLAIVIEGLLPYFSMEDKRAVLEHVRWTLDQFPGTGQLITSDFHTRTEMEAAEPLWDACRKRFEEVTRTDFKACAFESERQMLALLEETGFSDVLLVSQSSIFPIDRLAVPPRDPLARQFCESQRLAIAS